jgi:hypothetical protein
VEGSDHGLIYGRPTIPEFAYMTEESHENLSDRSLAGLRILARDFPNTKQVYSIFRQSAPTSQRICVRNS